MAELSSASTVILLAATLVSLRWTIYALPTSFEILTNSKKYGKVPLFLRVENTKKVITEIIEIVPKGD